jgi:FMN-dependent NADH-azoreductase
MNILHIDSCALGDNSASRQTTAAAVAALAAGNQAMTVHYRDLAAAPLSHVSGPLLQAISHRWDAGIPMNAELRAEALQSASLLQEFQEAELVVIGAPMHNFSIPSTLKAWMDRLLELQTSSQSERRDDTRVLLVTSGCGVTSRPQHEALQANHEQQLTAAFHAMGLTRLKVLRDVAGLQQLPEFSRAA